MKAQLRRDTQPEMVLRRALHATGLRYRVNVPVPGLPRRTIDVAFTRLRIAVFVHGCFWHRCPEHMTWPRANAEWWRTKIEGNVYRDNETVWHLQRLGWVVLEVWEHEGMDDAVARVRNAVASS